MSARGQLQQKLSYEFKDQNLLTQALTHRSKGAGNNERLEFLGDSILGFLVAEWLYDRFPDVDEGKLSRMRSTIVRKQTLAVIARDMQLQDVVILGEGEQKSGGFNRDSILADALEALIGAVYRDSDIEVTRSVVMGRFGSILDSLSLERIYKDPKSRLQEYLQQRMLPVPVYEVVNIEGEPHQQMFEVACRIEGHDQSFVAIGSSRRDAEQSAAERAFVSLNG
jgi:ribonuclease-3